MRSWAIRFTLGAVAFGVSLSACSSDPSVVVGVLPAPTGLFYELEPSGDPAAPAGVILSWAPIESSALQVYNVYSRLSSGASWDLRASTTSITFHDNGVPDLEYFVVGVDLDGLEGEPSEPVLIDERLRLESPASINSISLDQAVHVAWADNPFLNEPDGFKQYRVYSTFFDLDAGLCDDVNWALEGTTVAPEFIVAALPNGQPRCYGVSAESIEGWESLWSPIRVDTPRPDARNVLIFARQVNQSQSGFRFEETSGLLGSVTSGTRLDIDFFIDRDVNGDFFMVPVRSPTDVVLYSVNPIDDLTSIDIAPISGYLRNPIQASPGFGYVWRMDGGDGFSRFGGVRVTHVGPDYVIFDWSYQTDPGNPELSVHGGQSVSESDGVIVKRR